jgi:hypothetical protein
MPPGALIQANSPKRHAETPQLPGSTLARFLELRGRRIIQACAAVWYTVPGRFLMSLPYQRMLHPEPDELRHMLHDTRAFGARFPSLVWTGLESGLYVLRPGPYDISTLHVKHRPRVRRAQKCFEFRPAQKTELIDQGRTLNLSTMARQERYDPEFGDRGRWERLVEAAFACPGISIPAVFAGSRLSAYMIVCREDGWLHILHQMSRLEDLPDFPNHLLTYSVTAQAAADPSLEAVSYGYVPLFEADGLHEYKLRFGYQFVPHRSAIQLHPAIRTVAEHPVTRSVLRLARRLRPADQRLETIESVLNGARSSTRG